MKPEKVNVSRKKYVLKGMKTWWKRVKVCKTDPSASGGGGATVPK